MVEVGERVLVTHLCENKLSPTRAVHKKGSDIVVEKENGNKLNSISITKYVPRQEVPKINANIYGVMIFHMTCMCTLYIGTEASTGTLQLTGH